MNKSKSTEDSVIKFLRRRDYTLIKELGQGACGKTVLLRDDQIGESFVCKKYVPYSEQHRQEIFANFVREVKLLHRIHHHNVVRLFNHYLYPENYTGFILMEYIDGKEVDDYLTSFPEQINEVFIQAIAGFAYLERSGILHRDIRPGNVMVREDGIVKIIDLGFGKEIQNSEDFKKSISLNWWCQIPSEFGEGRYDFRTEVYFVGMLFNEIIGKNYIADFKYPSILARMCQWSPEIRIQSFSEIEKEIGNNQFFQIDFSEELLGYYRAFAQSVCKQISKIEKNAKYADDITRIENSLADVFRRIMLEENVPDCAVVIGCFITGTYFYRKEGMSVSCVKEFLQCLRLCTEERKRIILANLHTKFDALPRYEQIPESDDVPF